MMEACAASAALVAALLSVPAAAADLPDGPSSLRPHPAGSGWAWPLRDAGPPSVARTFEEAESAWGPGHRGVDLVAAHGDQVRSPADGTVAFAGVVVDRPVISIDHGNGLRTSLEPVRADVSVGDEVARGQVVGDIADGGHCGSGCLHWGLRLDGVYTDPLPTIRDLRPSILLPPPEP